MHKRHYPPDDKLQQLVRDAYNAMHALNVEVHYLSCDSGVGRYLAGNGPSATATGVMAINGTGRASGTSTRLLGPLRELKL